MRLEPSPPTSKFKIIPPEFPLLIKIKDKYSEYFYLIHSPQEAYDISLKLLTERLGEGYWYYEPEVKDTFEEYFLDYTGITLEEAAIFEKLKLSFQGYESLRKASDIIPALRKYHAREIAEKDEFARIKKAVEENDGKAAYNILLSRAKNEYEHFEVTLLANPEDM